MAAKSKLMLMSKIKAKKKPEHKASVEGDAPRKRLDRPSRVRRADGGIVEDYIKPGLPTAVPAAIQSLARRYLPSRRDPEMEAKLKDAASSAATGAGGALMKAGLGSSGKSVDGEEDRKKGGRVCK